MIDNFFEEEYHSYDLIYTNKQSGNHIYLGDAQSAMDNDFHIKCRIRTVLTAAKNMEHIIIGEGIKHITYPLLDGKSENIAIFFEKFYQMVESCIRKGSLLVHCAAGISRSSTLVISYLMRKERLTFKDAITLVRKSRPNVLPNLGFERQLKKYEEALRSGVKNSRNSRRSEVRTSESGKSQGSIRAHILPYVAAFSNMSANKNHPTEKMKNFIDKFSEKDIQILKIYNHGRKDANRNRIFLLNKGRNAMMNSINRHKVTKTEVDEQKELSSLQVLRLQNKRMTKSKMTIQEMQQVYNHKRTDPFQKKVPSGRGHTVNHLKTQSKGQF